MLLHMYSSLSELDCMLDAADACSGMRLWPAADLKRVSVLLTQILHTAIHTEDCNAAAEGQVSRSPGTTPIWPAPNLCLPQVRLQQTYKIVSLVTNAMMSCDSHMWLELRMTAGLIFLLTLVGMCNCERACMHVVFASCSATVLDGIDHVCMANECCMHKDFSTYSMTTTSKPCCVGKLHGLHLLQAEVKRHWSRLMEVWGVWVSRSSRYTSDLSNTRRVLLRTLYSSLGLSSMCACLPPPRQPCIQDEDLRIPNALTQLSSPQGRLAC